MKSCPTCNRTFENTLTFCLVDGAILSAPFDPQETQRIPQAKSTNLTPTEVIPQHASPNNPALPPTIVDTRLGRSQRKRIIGAVVGLIIGIILFLIFIRNDDNLGTLALLAISGALVGAFYAPIWKIIKSVKGE